MTFKNPRIYTYKITFEEVLYYYYGVHREKRFDEYYMGSPITHKWMWDFYTPKKQILQFFEYNDEGWLEAQEVEKRLIKSFYNSDKWCLNENCGGKYSLSLMSEAGKIGGNTTYKLGLGIHSFSEEKRKNNSKKAGEKAKELGVGIFNLTSEELSKFGSKGVERLKQENKGIFSLTREQLSENGKKYGSIGGKKAAEHHRKNGTGFFGQTSEQKSKAGKIGGKVGGKIACKNTNSQKWECCETGYVSTAAGVVSYQKGRGIDTSKSNRKRIA
jgi:hypothetical protein